MFLVTLFLAACTTTAAAGGDYICTNVPEISNKLGAINGAGCVNNSDCQYGVCKKGALQLAGHVTTTEGVCTKDCACGGPSSQCSADDDEVNGVHFKCIKAPKGGVSECAIQCASLADCQKVNPRFTACTASSSAFQTAVKICTIE
jgi:hypothetical protein